MLPIVTALGSKANLAPKKSGLIYTAPRASIATAARWKSALLDRESGLGLLKRDQCSRRFSLDLIDLSVTKEMLGADEGGDAARPRDSSAKRHLAI